MQIHGAFEVPALREAVYLRLTDAALMARCVPGCESVERIDATSYRAVVAVGMGGISARFNLVVQITEESPPERIVSRTRGEEGSRASVLAADNLVTLEQIADGVTRVRYQSDVSITGRLGKFALGVMKKKVESLGAEFAQRLCAAIAGSPPAGVS